MSFFYTDYTHVNINNDNTLIIIDWDDTIFASTNIVNVQSLNMLNNQNNKADNKTISHLFEELIMKLINLGKVVIVTSSRHDWVLLSAEQYFSTTVVNILKNIDIYYVEEFLDKHNIYNIGYEDKKSKVIEIVIKNFIDNKATWNPFKNILDNSIKRKDDINIISLGDGFQESNAYFYITQNSTLNERHNIIYKHIEYKKKPTLMELIKEYKLILKVILMIINKTYSSYYSLYFDTYDTCFIYEKKNAYKYGNGQIMHKFSISDQNF